MGNKLKKRYDFPIKFFEGNLCFNEHTKDCWAIYQLSGITYEFLSEDTKIHVHQRLSRFLANIGEQAKIFLIPVAQDYQSIYQAIRERLSPADPLQKTALIHAAGVESYLGAKLKERDNANDYNCYVCVKLRKQLRNTTAAEALAEPIKAIHDFFTTDAKDIRERELRLFHDAAERYVQEQGKRMRLSPVSVETMQWLIRRMFLRGTGKQVDLRRNLDGSPWTPAKERYQKNGEVWHRPFRKDILTLGGEVLEHKKCSDYLSVKNSDGTISYQSFLPFSYIPEQMEFLGSEWLYLLQELPLATEVCISIKTIDYESAVKKIDRNLDEVKGQMKHVAESGVEMPEELYEAEETSKDMKAEIKAYKDPLMETGISICVASSDLEDLKHQVNYIRTTYKDLEFHLEKPFTDQLDYFFEFIPGGPILCRDYALKLPPRTLAGSMFPVKKRLGDGEGHYIGTTGIMRKMVFLALERACQLNRSASAAFLGTLGGGKSFNANLLLYLSIMSGGRGLVIDPKGERGNWEQDLPELEGQIHTATLTQAETDRGKLDPFIIYRDSPDEGAELASAMLIDWLDIASNSDEDTALAEAINMVKYTPQPSMLKLIDVLEAFQEEDELSRAARRLARKIKNKQDIGMTKLIFGYGNEKALAFDRRVNILQIQNIQLPESTKPKADYSDTERLSTVLMLPISSFAKKFVQQKTDTFKVVLLDESWALKTTSMGQALYSYLARTGRSQYAAAIFIGHSVKDVADEGIKEALTYKFLFQVSTDEEARRACGFLGIEDTEDNIERLQNLENGHCLFSDLDGNVDELAFDAVYRHLMDAFNTNPTKRKVE